MRLEKSIQLIENQARFDPGGAGLDVEVEDPVQVFGNVDDDRFADCLAALRCAAAPGQDRHAFVGGDFDDAGDIIGGLRDDAADRFYLVVGGIGRITAAAERVEQNLALYLPP